MALIIKELYIAEFGGIKNKKIEFDSDKALNIIYGENESGKSTVFLFIKFMLYGLQRKSPSNTERERSLSWSGSVAAGSLTLEHSGKMFRIERSFSDRARGEKLVILSLDSGVPISTDRTPGEYFIGVPREVFESSACVGQMRSGEINGEKTAQVLSNMLSSADEGIDTASVLKELNAIRISYLHKNQAGGSLYEDEAKINSLSMKLDEAKNASLAIEG
ncbi:MAG: AAA family ATPase, partial [Clostridia bacterium]|nr:AAA family ATPase [Clostridia bacterium]